MSQRICHSVLLVNPSSNYPPSSLLLIAPYHKSHESWSGLLMCSQPSFSRLGPPPIRIHLKKRDPNWAWLPFPSKQPTRAPTQTRTRALSPRPIQQLHAFSSLGPGRCRSGRVGKPGPAAWQLVSWEASAWAGGSETWSCCRPQSRRL